MSARLTQTVVAAGRIFPTGTVRSGDAAETVGDGPWWSGSTEPQEPPRSGKGSGVEAWREHAETVGVEVADDATRDDIIAAVDAAAH